MSSSTIPLAMPADLLGEIRSTAKATGLSQADVMRQSMKLGMPALRKRLSLEKLKPLTREEIRQCYEVPDLEFDALAAHCASLQKAPPEED